MAFQTSTVTIVSNNPLYPNNKIDIIVDNDLRSEVTVVVPNTAFSFIVEFENCEEAVGKRYISERFYNDLTNEISGKYNTNKGRIFSTLQKDATIYPYITINYSDFIGKVKEEKEKEKKVGTKKFKELNYYGSNIQDFENYNPIKLLQWLDISLQNSDGSPKTQFPYLLEYSVITDGKVDVDLVDRKIQDFFATEYIADVDYSTSSDKITVTPPEYVNTNDLNSKSTLLNESKNKSKGKSIANILDKISNIKGSILAGTSLAAAALLLKDKLSNLKPPVPKIPKVPVILPAIVAAKRKIKKTEQKPKKKKKILGKKNQPVSEKPAANPKLDNLKSQAGGLIASATAAKSAAIAKQQSIVSNIPTGVV